MIVTPKYEVCVLFIYGIFRGVGAGFLAFSLLFKAVGEPATTGF
jgi:hypothetical protein